MAAGGGDPYLVLGVERTATSAEILEAYRRLIRQSGQMAAAGGGRGGRWLTQVDDAYAVLGDPRRRSEYDSKIGLAVRACRHCGLPLRPDEDRYHETCVEPERPRRSAIEGRRRFWSEVARSFGWGNSG